MSFKIILTFYIKNKILKAIENLKWHNHIRRLNNGEKRDKDRESESK